MGLPLVESCCICIPLRAGTLVLGYMHLIVSVIALILSTYKVNEGRIYLQEVEEDAISDARKSEKKETGIFLLTVGSVLIIILIIQFVFNIILLVGAHNRKPRLIKIYLVYYVVMLVIALILSVATLLTVNYKSELSNFISYVIEVYFMLVIRSYMIKLRDNPEGERAGEVDKS